MDRPRRIACLLVLALAVALGACGGEKDSADTIGPASTDPSATTDTAGPATTAAGPTTEGTDTTEGAAGGAPTVDGGASAEGTVAGTTPTTHEVVVPDGMQAVITVTPGGDYDIVAEVDGDTTDDGLSGDAETVRVSGPATISLDVYGYYDDAAGPYTVTIEAA